MKTLAVLSCLSIASTATAGPIIQSTDPGCTSLTPAAIGGPMPPEHLAAVRWFGTTNYEIAYREQVILLDTFYDRGPRARPIGFTTPQVKRADAIFIGHAHADHIADVSPVARQTHAKVYGPPLTIEEAIKLGVPTAQTQPVRNADILKFKGFTVEAIRAHHSVLAPAVMKAFGDAISAATGTFTPAEQAADDKMWARGSEDPRITKEGTFAWLFTFDSGFRLIYRNSAGPITDAEQAALRRIGGRTDVAIVAYIGQFAAARQIGVTLPIVQLYNPRLYLPSHHDELPGIFVDMGTEPLFMAIRDQMPQTRSYSPLYREPVCLTVESRE